MSFAERIENLTQSVKARVISRVALYASTGVSHSFTIWIIIVPLATQNTFSSRQSVPWITVKALAIPYVCSFAQSGNLDALAIFNVVSTVTLHTIGAIGGFAISFGLSNDTVSVVV